EVSMVRWSMESRTELSRAERIRSGKISSMKLAGSFRSPESASSILRLNRLSRLASSPTARPPVALHTAASTYLPGATQDSRMSPNLCLNREMKASQILERTAVKYANCISYSDSGLVEFDTPDDFHETICFRTRFERPSLFTFEWQDYGPNRR